MKEERKKTTISRLIKECKAFIKTFFTIVIVGSIILFLPLTIVSIVCDIETAILLWAIVFTVAAIVTAVFASFRIFEETGYLD